MSLRVFISYAHHPHGEVDAFTDLAKRLRADGFDVRFDQFDPDPRAGWPLWMLRELEAADVILLGCSRPWKGRFMGTVDAYGGKGVRWEGHIMRNMAYHASDLSRFRAVIVGRADPAEVIPMVFADVTHVVFAEGYDGLVKWLRTIPAPVQDGASSPSCPDVAPEPILQPIEFEVVVVGGHAMEPLVRALGPGALTVSSPDDPEVQKAHVVVTATAPPNRVLASRDREVVQVDEADISNPPGRAAAVKAVQAAVHRLHARWWRQSGRDFVAGLLVALAWPVAAAHAAEHRQAPFVAVAGTISSGCLLLAGVGAGLGQGSTAVLVGPRARGPLTANWQYLRGSLRRAVPSEPAVFRGMAIKVALVLAVLWSGFFLRDGLLSPRESGLVAGQLMLAYGFAALSWTSFLRAPSPFGSLGAAVCSAAAAALPRIAAEWTRFIGSFEEALALIFAVPDFSAPSTWVTASPATLPFTSTLALAAAFVAVWAFAVPLAEVWLRRTAVAILALGCLLVWLGI